MSCGTCGLAAGLLTFDPLKDNNLLAWLAWDELPIADLPKLVSPLIYLTKDNAARNGLKGTQKKALEDVIANICDFTTNIGSAPSIAKPFFAGYTGGMIKVGGKDVPVPLQAIQQWTANLFETQREKAGSDFATSSYKRDLKNGTEILGVFTLLEYAIKHGSKVPYHSNQSARLGKAIIAGKYLLDAGLLDKYGSLPTIVSQYEVVMDKLPTTGDGSYKTGSYTSPYSAPDVNSLTLTTTTTCPAEVKTEKKNGKIIGYKFTNTKCGTFHLTYNSSKAAWRVDGKSGNYLGNDSLLCTDLKLIAKQVGVNLFNTEFCDPYWNAPVDQGQGDQEDHSGEIPDVPVVEESSNTLLYVGLGVGALALLGGAVYLYKTRG